MTEVVLQLFMLATGDTNDLELLALLLTPHRSIQSMLLRNFADDQGGATGDGHALRPQSVDAHRRAQAFALQVFQLTGGRTNIVISGPQVILQKDITKV